MEPLVVDAGEADIDALLDALEDGRHVVVKTEFLGSSHDVILRYDGVWYCDTPTRLHKHESREEMRACLKQQGYGE